MSRIEVVWVTKKIWRRESARIVLKSEHVRMGFGWRSRQSDRGRLGRMGRIEAETTVIRTQTDCDQTQTSSIRFSSDCQPTQTTQTTAIRPIRQPSDPSDRYPTQPTVFRQLSDCACRIKKNKICEHVQKILILIRSGHRPNRPIRRLSDPSDSDPTASDCHPTDNNFWKFLGRKQSFPSVTSP